MEHLLVFFFFFFFLSRGTYSYSYKSIGAGTACIPYYSVHTLYLQSSFSISVRICHSAWMITVRIGFQVLCTLYILLVVALEIYPVGMIPHNNQSLQSSQLLWSTTQIHFLPVTQQKTIGLSLAALFSIKFLQRILHILAGHGFSASLCTGTDNPLYSGVGSVGTCQPEVRYPNR